MYIPSLKETFVVGVKPSPVSKNTYIITLSTAGGGRSNLKYSKEKMQEVMEHTGVTKPEELKRHTVVITDRNKVAFLPEGAELTIAARDKDGKLIEFDFV